MTITAFLIMGLIFFIFSYFVQGIWIYFIPATSSLILLWLITIIMRNNYVAKNILRNYSELFSLEQEELLLNSPSIFLMKTDFITLFAQIEPSAASGYIMFISIGYAIFSIYLQNWFTLIISIFIIIIILWAVNVSFPKGSDDDFIGAIIRYCRANKINRKTLTAFELEHLLYNYGEILGILKELRQGNVNIIKNGQH
ncbi:MAG: hypothetical protein KJ822_00255 [Proteobacteria bacterium]|nr:hypothetical protein [Pseudomonadota bacterium]